MNPEAQALFDEIVAKDANCLTEGDIIFLKARSQYLSRELKKKYAAELGEEIQPKPEPEEVKREEWSEHPADKKVEEDDDDDE